MYVCAYIYRSDRFKRKIVWKPKNKLKVAHLCNIDNYMAFGHTTNTFIYHYRELYWVYIQTHTCTFIVHVRSHLFPKKK